MQFFFRSYIKEYNKVMLSFANMSLKHYIFLLFIYIWQSTNASENNHFCFIINPQFKLEVTKSGLEWGKWIKGWGNYEYERAPTPGDIIKADEKRTICSSGRQSSSSGTEGFVEFKDEHNRRITVKWNNPWGAGEEYARVEADSKIFYVSGSAENGRWYLNYFIDYVWPNTPRLAHNVNYTIPWSRLYYYTCLKNSCIKNFSCKNSIRVRREDSDNDSDNDSCDAAADSYYDDHLFRTNIYQGVTNADPGTVDNDARRFEQDYPPTLVPHNAQQPNPVYQYSAVYFPALDLSLPIVVRARVDLETVKAAGKRNPSGIRDAAKELTDALKRVKHHDILSYHVGHMVAWVLGGPDAAYNFAPQTELLNLGQYKRMENNIKRFVRDHPEGWVDMTVVIYYWHNTFMPVAFGVNLVYYFTSGVLASNCRDTMFWNQRPYPRDPPAIG